MVGELRAGAPGFLSLSHLRPGPRRTPLKAVVFLRPLSPNVRGSQSQRDPPGSRALLPPSPGMDGGYWTVRRPGTDPGARASRPLVPAALTVTGPGWSHTHEQTYLKPPPDSEPLVRVTRVAFLPVGFAHHTGVGSTPTHLPGSFLLAIPPNSAAWRAPCSAVREEGRRGPRFRLCLPGLARVSCGFRGLYLPGLGVWSGSLTRSVQGELP